MAQSANSQSVTSSTKDNGVLCDCNRSVKIVRAWTRENPGRRFLGCIGRRVGNRFEYCNFFHCFDVEKPHGWHNLALLEARDIIREQKEEIARLSAWFLWRSWVMGRPIINPVSKNFKGAFSVWTPKCSNTVWNWCNFSYLE
ncbi:unnamed protein product [Thlaspi arvense]|uniref:DUF7900 domain-containing protein n=1 Tax=Thlaspi arvense TaxID=13288 RepID=A0AAU9STM8_THLAR|nr:unnamed protein product [Thlaspi arvense]